MTKNLYRVHIESEEQWVEKRRWVAADDFGEAARLALKHLFDSGTVKSVRFIGQVTVPEAKELK